MDALPPPLVPHKRPNTPPSRGSGGSPSGPTWGYTSNNNSGASTPTNNNERVSPISPANYGLYPSMGGNNYSNNSLGYPMNDQPIVPGNLSPAQRPSLTPSPVSSSPPPPIDSYPSPYIPQDGNLYPSVPMQYRPQSGPQYGNQNPPPYSNGSPASPPGPFMGSALVPQPAIGGSPVIPQQQAPMFSYTPATEPLNGPAGCPPLRPSPPPPVSPPQSPNQPVQPPFYSPTGSDGVPMASSGSSGQLMAGQSSNHLIDENGTMPAGVRPVCFRVRHHVIAGVAAALQAVDAMGTFDTYSMDLHGIKRYFGQVYQGWNTKYPAAQQIFGRGPMSAGIRAAIHAQHVNLYCSIVRRESQFRSGMDFLTALNYGFRGGVPRSYTYVILDGKMRFSETGAAFLKDKLSKHAVHSNAMPEVRYAGEFHIQPVSGNGARPWLVIDNNSGTYAPSKDLLPAVQALLQYNFPDLKVEALDREDPKYKQYIAELKARKK